MASVDSYAFATAAAPFGVVGPARLVQTSGWLPSGCSIYTAFTGNVSAVSGQYRDDFPVGYGAGRAYHDPGRAKMLAVSEAMERYATMLADGAGWVTASASELGGDAMDLDLVPRCSPRELRNPHCPLRNAQKDDKLRWVPGTDMLTGGDVFLPVVMVYLGIDREPAECFWTPISTGCAAHTTVAAALVNAICEVIERDAVALTWLQRLPLPRLDGACVPEEAHAIMRWCADRGVRTHLFDATTELGVPTVYCAQTTRTGTLAAQLVASATDFDVPAAVLRAVLEAAGTRASIYSQGTAPPRYRDYSAVRDGAVLMGNRARRSVFGFLLGSAEERPVSRPESVSFASPEGTLAYLLECLADHGVSVFAVDLTTRDLSELGLVAVRVIMPELQPMSLRPLTQYRAHPRLYRGPAAMGMRVLPESKLNPYPQPVT